MRILIAECGERSANFVRAIDETIFDVTRAHLSSVSSLKSFDCVLPMRIQDTWFLQRNFRRLNGHLFFIPTPKALDIADDKVLFNQFLIQHGYADHVPEFRSQTHCPFPFVLKKRRDAGGVHTTIINNRQEELAAQPLIQQNDYFTQPYVPGNTEFTDHILFADGKVAHACTIEFNMNQDLYVRGTQMQPYRNVQMSVKPPKHLGLFSSILQQLSFSGMCCFNYKIVNGIPKIFELNPRVGGSAHLDINSFLVAMKDGLKPRRSRISNLLSHFAGTK